MIAVSSWAPPQVVSSSSLEDEIRARNPAIRLDIEGTTGVRERRAVAGGTSIVDMAEHACAAVFRQSGMDPDMVDLVIFSSVSRENMEPSTAVSVCQRLGIRTATAFDISNACLGFVDAWMTADAMIQSGRCRLALIVGAEKSSDFWKLALGHIERGTAEGTAEDFRPLLPAFTLGDGAAAMLVGARQERAGHVAALAGARESHGEFHELCVIKNERTPMVTDARGLFTAALERTPRVAGNLLRHLGWSSHELDLVIPHQASSKVIEQGRILVSIPEGRMHTTLDRFGNMASVSVPFTLAEALRTRDLSPGQRILIMGYGSGLGLGMLALQIASR